MDKEFWKERYESDSSIPSKHSRFAEHCLESGKIKPKDQVLELGHGNGRDAFYFAKNGVRVIGIDQSGKTWVNDGRLKLMRGDFTSGDDVTAILMKVVNKKDPKVDHVYSRFTWHSISSVDEQNVLDWLRKTLKPSSTVLIECRTVFDSIYGLGTEVSPHTFVFENHCRRFISPGKLVDKLLLKNFCVTAELSRGFAPYGDQDPLVLRTRGVLKI